MAIAFNLTALYEFMIIISFKGTDDGDKLVYHSILNSIPTPAVCTILKLHLRLITMKKQMMMIVVVVVVVFFTLNEQSYTILQ